MGPHFGHPQILCRNVLAMVKTHRQPIDPTDTFWLKRSGIELAKSNYETQEF